MGRRDAVQRPRGAHHHPEGVQLRAVDRWAGARFGRRSIRARSCRSTRGSERPAPNTRLLAPDTESTARRPGHGRPGTAPPGKQASNFLVVDPRRSKAHNTLAVMGPQLGYYYPEIVQQIHLSGPGIEAQGAAVPGMAMYILIGRTADYAWSLTSANHDVRDVFAEQLCEPDGSAPTRDTDHYLFNGVADRSCSSTPGP